MTGGGKIADRVRTWSGLVRGRSLRSGFVVGEKLEVQELGRAEAELVMPTSRRG